VVTVDGPGARDDRSSAPAAARVSQNTPGIGGGGMLNFVMLADSSLLVFLLIYLAKRQHKYTLRSLEIHIKPTKK